MSRKLAATQELQRKDTEIEIERKERTKREVQAQGIANAMQIIRGQLSAMYIQHEAIEAQKLMVNSPNHTVVYIPVGPDGRAADGHDASRSGAGHTVEAPSAGQEGASVLGYPSLGSTSVSEPSSWADAKRIFSEALDLPRATRDAFVASACGAASELLGEVRSLLAWHDQSTGFLEEPAARLQNLA